MEADCNESFNVPTFELGGLSQRLKSAGIHGDVLMKVRSSINEQGVSKGLGEQREGWGGDIVIHYPTIEVKK